MLNKGRAGFDPAKHLPDGFHQVLMREFFYSSMAECQACLEGIMTLLRQHAYLTSEEEAAQAQLCIDEALVNAVKHGNKHDNNKKVHVTLYGGDGQWAIRVEDEGEGFTAKDLPDYQDDETLFWDHGRGVLLINTFMDEVYYYDRGNRVLLVKYSKRKA